MKASDLAEFTGIRLYLPRVRDPEVEPHGLQGAEGRTSKSIAGSALRGVRKYRTTTDFEVASYTHGQSPDSSLGT